VRIRPAELPDAEQIAEIYNREVLGSTATFDLVPRSIEDQRTWLIERSGAHVVLVAEDDGESGLEVAGFASLSPFRSRPAYSTTVECSVYVHPSHRRKGAARLLMIDLLATAQSHGFHSIIARIADSQEASLALHADMGFDLVGVERQIGRKFGRWLDVSVMQVML
jgi:L-amino acid N-acyltransferase YncA